MTLSISDQAGGASESAFRKAYEAGQPSLVCRKLIDDLETPVSAYLKLGRKRPFSFLFESVEGGALSGRYSILTLSPDLVWRYFGARAEIARGADIAEGRYTPEAEPSLQSLRALVDANRMAIPDGLPPMASGLFGVFGGDVSAAFFLLLGAGAIYWIYNRQRKLMAAVDAAARASSMAASCDRPRC